ncbi:MAG: hypothetical protein ACWA5X_11485 [bacterium]
MLSRFFKSEHLPDQDTVDWLFDVFEWSLVSFDAAVFFRETVLVTPTNEHFPGKQSDIHGAATQIFSQVQEHAGLSHWPCEVMDAHACQALEAPKVVVEGDLRGAGGIVQSDVAPENRLTITYDPNSLSDPEVMISTYAHTLAHYLGSMARSEAPGGEENWPFITEVLAVFMGFGVIFANSALKFKGGCGSCAGNFVDRESFLSQYDVTYALAIFCQLKGISNKDATRHLKKSLRGFYSQAVKDVASHVEALERLKGYKQQALTTPGQAVGAS